MFDFEKPNIDIVEISEDKRYGKFVVPARPRSTMSATTPRISSRL